MAKDVTECRIRNFSASICDVFEDLLDKHDITIPDDDRTGDESEARLYGSTYGNLEDAVTQILSACIAEVKANPNVEINTTDY